MSKQCVDVCMYVCFCVYVCIYVCMYVYVSVYMCVCVFDKKNGSGSLIYSS